MSDLTRGITVMVCGMSRSGSVSFGDAGAEMRLVTSTASLVGRTSIVTVVPA
jgi:hypothetical protein